MDSTHSGEENLGPLAASLTRRQLVRLALVGAAATLIQPACRSSAAPSPTTPAPGPDLRATPTYTPFPSATSQSRATALPLPTPEVTATFPPLTRNAPTNLQNRNDPHYNVRYVRPFAPVDHNAWRLEVRGLVETPGSFGLVDLLDWPQMEQVSRMKCVECWSFKAKWGGFHYQTLAGRVKPKAEATHVRFDCADGYWEIVSLEELAHPRVIFVLRMNDELLLDEYGAPLRMMFPSKYGYKSAKAVTTITFSDHGDAGFWSTVGPYTIDGDIQAGVDYPQDLPAQPQRIEGGEITAY